MRNISAILQDLESWRRGQCPADRVAPLGQATEDERVRMRLTLERGLARARAGVRYISPSRIDPEQIDSDTAESIALGLVVQVYEFLDLPDDAVVEDRDVKRLRIAYRLMKRLEPLLVAHPAGADRRPTVQLMQAQRAARTRALPRGAATGGGGGRAAEAPAERPEPIEEFTDDAEVTGEFDLAEDDPESTLDQLLGEGRPPRPSDLKDSLDQILGEEIPSDVPDGRFTTLDPPEDQPQELIARAVDSADQPPTAAQVQPQGNPRFQLVAIGVLLLLAVAALASLVPRLMSAVGPSVDSYSELVPAVGMIRLAEPEPTLVLIVDERWDVMAGADRTKGALAAYELGVEREGIRTLIVRDDRGHEAARVREGTVSLGP